MVGSAVCNEAGLPSANCFVYLERKQPQRANQLKMTKSRQGNGWETVHTSAISGLPSAMLLFQASLPLHLFVY